MTLKSDIDQLAADAVLMHQVVHGDATTIVTTAGGPVRSVAKLIADKDAEINVASSGIFAQSVVQVAIATALKDLAQSSASQSAQSAANAANSAGTAGQYSTALAAIASQTQIVPAATVLGFNGVVVASAIDATRNWSDGGAARKRVQDTGWYNEETTATGKNLGKLASLAAAWAVPGAAVGDHYYDTTTKLFYSISGTSAAPTRAEIFRGPRKDRPETVIWTAEAGRVIGWDLTDASCPMWMIFNCLSAAYTNNATQMCLNTVSSICVAGDGILLVGGDTGLVLIDFISEEQTSYRSFGKIRHCKSGNLALRNDTSGHYQLNSVGIISQAVSSVAATILPYAPINPSTGLPVPTIAVSTSGGVSVITQSGAISNLTKGFNDGAGMWGTVHIDASGVYVASIGNAGQAFLCKWPDFSATTVGGYTAVTAQGSVPSSPNSVMNVDAFGFKSVKCKRGFAFNNTNGLGLLFDNPSSAAYPGSNVMYQQLYAAITSTYNSGLQVGDSRAAWLADTVAGVVIGTVLDRSIKANPLTVVGTLTKSAVAAGSQLMAYSGFSAANYLEQAYSNNLDFGTGDFCYPIWINPTNAAQNATLFTRSPAVLAGNGFALNLVGGVLQLGRSIGGAAFANTTFGYTPPINCWMLVNLVRVAGVIALRINGVQQAMTIADANNYTNTTAAFTVGVDYAHSNPFIGSMALLRASSTPASTDQGAFRYAMECKLFLPGAQCCIAGTSTAVAARDYDYSTDLLSVATSWGVTEFQGLKAINSYATTVGAPSAISTRGGYKLLSGATGSSFYKPSRLLAEELTRTYEQRKAFGSTPICKVFDAIAGQTDFALGLKETPTEMVYVAGVWKRMGATKAYTVFDDGFRKTLRFAVSPGAVEVAIFYVKEL